MDILTTLTKIILEIVKSDPSRVKQRLSRKKDRWAGRQYRKIKRFLKKMDKSKYSTIQKRTLLQLKFPSVGPDTALIIFPKVM